MKTPGPHARRRSALCLPLTVLAFAIPALVGVSWSIAGDAIRLTNDGGQKILVTSRAVGSPQWSKLLDIPPRQPNAVPTVVLVELGDADAYDILFCSYDSHGVTVFELGSLHVRELASGLSALVLHADKLGTFRVGQNGDWAFEESRQDNALPVGASATNGKLGMSISQR